MNQSTNPFSACVDTLLAPEKAFNSTKDKNGWSWVPFALIIVTMTATFLYYFSVVDFEWLKTQMIDQMAATQELSDDELTAISDNYSLAAMKWGSIIGGNLAIICVSLLVAVYFNIVSKIVTKSDISFTQWYGFTWWTNLPIVVSSLVSILVVVFAPDGLILMQDLQPTSLNSLVLGLDPTNAWYGLAEGINLFAFWSIFIISVGLKSWLNIEQNKALMIAIGPTAIIYGAWALYVLATA